MSQNVTFSCRTLAHIELVQIFNNNIDKSSAHTYTAHLVGCMCPLYFLLRICNVFFLFISSVWFKSIDNTHSNSNLLKLAQTGAVVTVRFLRINAIESETESESDIDKQGPQTHPSAL